VNAKDSNKMTVAEFTIGLIIALSRNVLLYDKELRAGNWKIRQTLGMDLEDRTLGIIGMGAIGSLVAHKAVLGLGMKVIAHKRSLAGFTPMAGVTCTQNMDEVIGSADFLSLHVPSTPETKALIGRREFGLMKPEAFLINTARGDVVDNKALYEALHEKIIAGAALDVFPGEVIGKSDPLLSLSNVILTPHAAAFTEQSVARMSLYAASGIHEVLSGRVPTRPVNMLVQAALN
jgi:D-3-phosphoglycerate dehydrogenase